MGTEHPFFLSPTEIYKSEHPEEFEKKTPQRKKKPPKVYDCTTCGLASKCKSPKIKRYGKGQKDILLIGLCPGRVEDKYGIPFVGPSGSFLRKQLKLFGIDLDIDCIRTNVVQCFPGLDKKGNDKKPTKEQLLCCRNRVLKDIQEVNPKLIICLGKDAIQAILQPKSLDKFTAGGTHGFTFPSQEYGCWVGCSFHPSFFVRKKKEKGIKNDDIVFSNDMADILSVLDAPLPKPLTEEGNLLITDANEAVELLDYFSKSKKPTTFDYETNAKSCYDEGAKILTVSITDEVESSVCIPIDFEVKGKKVFLESDLVRVLEAFKKYLASDAPKALQNYYMEELWSRVILGQSIHNFIHDTMVTAHVLNCRRKTTNLGFQAYNLTGHDYKKMVDVKDLQSEPLENTANYNNFDSRYQLMSYYDQKSKLELDPKRKEFNDFFTRCLPVLANLKHRGMNVDVDIMNEMDLQYSDEKEDLLAKIKELSGIIKYESIEDKKGRTKQFNPDSGPHLEKVLYDIYKEKKVKETTTGRGSTDEEALFLVKQNTNNKEVATLIDSILRFRKCCSLTERAANYRRLMDRNHILHPTYNLNVVDTYRSSANDPNSQNVFNQDKELRKFRTCIIPRPGNSILEVDYGGLEVRIIAMLSKDPVLTHQMIESQKWDKEHPEGGINPFDPHRRWAARIYSKAIEDISKKPERYNGKNGFVFPSFYGSIYTAIARYEGFRGISEAHIKKVQEQFWAEYKEVKKWQEDQVKFYNEYGCFVGPMGCRRPGPLSYFQLYNNVIQGAGFHLLLDALQKIDDEMIRRGMESYAFLEVHDDINFDTVPDEEEEIISLSTEIMCSKRFDWQGDVPLCVEWEKGKDWYSLEALKI